MKKSNIELKRVSMNLPKDLVESVKKYALSLGVNVTTAFILLINEGRKNEQIQK